MNNTNSVILHVASLLKELKMTPFPKDSNDDELSKIHAELAEFDGFIVGLVQSFIEGEAVNLDLLKRDELLANKIKAKLKTLKDAYLLNEAKDYFDYLSKIHNLIDAF